MPDHMDSDVLRRISEVERIAQDAKSQIIAHVLVCAEIKRAIGLQFDGVYRRLNVVLGMSAVLIIGELLGWQKAISAALKLLGIS